MGGRLIVIETVLNLIVFEKNGHLGEFVWLRVKILTAYADRMSNRHCR